MYGAARFGAALAVLALVGAAYVTPAQAQQGSGAGEVRRIDAEAGKITIKHGAIAALDLPALTLVYLIDSTLLTGLQPGDKVKFTARRENGHYVVVQISK